MKKVLLWGVGLLAVVFLGMYAMAWMGTQANEDALAELGASKDAVVFEVSGMT